MVACNWRWSSLGIGTRLFVGGKLDWGMNPIVGDINPIIDRINVADDRIHERLVPLEGRLHIPPRESLIVLAALHQYGALKEPDIARRTSLDRERVALALHDLSALGVVASHGKAIYESVVTRETGDGAMAASKTDRIVQIIRSLGGAASVPQIAAHYGRSYTTTLRLLKSMESEGLVRHRGSTRSSEYYV